MGVVKAAATDGQVCDWIRENVEADDSTKELFNDAVLNYGADETNSELRERLATRKAEAGMGDRDESSVLWISSMPMKGVCSLARAGRISLRLYF